MATYFEMGGYAWFVWPAYAFSAVIMGGLVVNSLIALRRDRKILDALEAANPRRAMRRGTSSAEPSPTEPAAAAATPPAPTPEEARSDA